METDMEITLETVAASLASQPFMGGKQYLVVEYIRHGDKSESRGDFRKIGEHLYVWRVMYRPPHDKRKPVQRWPAEQVIGCGFARTPHACKQAAERVIKEARKQRKKAAAA
jgi:hypothetical protein